MTVWSSPPFAFSSTEEAEGKFQIEHEKPVAGCRIVSKQDLGKFLVESLLQDEHVHKRVGMGTVAPVAAAAQ